MSRWARSDDVQRGADYDERWKAMAAAGESVHGEADLVCALIADYRLAEYRLAEHRLDASGVGLGGRVLDAGCGTGRVAIELAARGVDASGVDLDDAMLSEARAKAPNLRWVPGDLVDVDLGAEFDLVVMAGNVMIFVAPGTEAAVVANVARHVRRGGLLVAGFQTGDGRLAIRDYDRHADAAGLELVERWSTWDRRPYSGGSYAVSLHRRP